MVSKNNLQVKDRYATKQVPHYGIRKLSVGVASVLLGTTFYMGMNGNVVHADTVDGQDSETSDSQVVNNNGNNNSKSDLTADSDANKALGDSQAVVSAAEDVVKSEINSKPQVTEIKSDNHVQSDANAAKSDVDANVQSDVANVKSDSDVQSQNNQNGANTMHTPQTQTMHVDNVASQAGNISPNAVNANLTELTNDTVTVSTVGNAVANSVPTTPVANEASHEPNSQAQPSSVTNTTQTKLSHRQVMRLAAVPTTNSDELIVGKDVTISDFSVTVAKGKNEFENAHANIKFTMHADDPSVLAGKRLTIRVDKKVWNGFYSSKQQGSNPATISYQGHVIGTFNYGYPFDFVYIKFNDDVKNYTKIDVQADLVIAGSFQRDIPYITSLYTSTQAKDGQTYYLINDVTIGQQKYSSNLPSVIHYQALDSEFVSSVTDVTTTSYDRNDSKLYAGTFYKTPNGIYYSHSSIYGGNNLYSEKSGQSGYLDEPSINVGTDIVTDRTQSYTATSDIDQTKLSPDRDSKLTPITSYYLDKDYWDDKNLLPNTRDVYANDSHTSSSTATADATVTKNGVIFNKLNGQSLATRIVNVESTDGDGTSHVRTNYATQIGKLYLTPALFKQFQAVAESDQNLAEALNTVKTTGDAKIKLVNPINTGFKVTIKTSDGKTKELPLLIDTIDYRMTTASTAPKGSILLSAQGKTVKVYHPGDQNIPAVVDQSQLTKTITRTINVHEPGKSVTTIKQTVVLTQSVSVVDGKDVTYNGDWKVQGDSQWASYDVPNVPGYTASQSRVAQQTVTDTTKDQTIDITYTANEHQISIEYVDNATGHVVKIDHVSGKTGQTVSITPHAPDGWELISGQSVPSEVTLGADGAPATVIKVQPQERSVAVKFVDDEDFNQQVGQAITLTGRDGDTVKVNVTVPEPDKYRLADGQQLPTTYTFTNGSGDVTIHLVHKVVQREATVNLKLAMMTEVDIEGVDWTRGTITQERWGQLGDKFNDVGPGAFFTILPSVEVGTLTGHVNYDVVDSKVVSLGDDWTTLNLGGHTYQLPNGVDVVNGVLIDSDDGSFGKPLREYYLNHYSIIHPDHSVDPDYATRPWHGYLSVNATNDPNSPLAEWSDLGLQGGLAGNEPNALAKSNGDRAATAVEMANKTIDVSLLGTDLFSEQDGRLQATLPVPVVGVYIPYVEKTATRTINVITPDGKTTTVKQTATLEKQVDLRKDVHPDWTTGEWTIYDVPIIPGYTASQSNVAKETVTGITEDQTVNVTYTPDAQKLNVKFIDDTTGQVLKTVTKTGVTNANAGYNTQSDIQSYEGQHYVLVSDSSHGVNLVFDNDDNIDQAYEVHLRHGAHQIDEHHTITQIVHYIATDHSGVPDDHMASVQFDRDGYHDEVTGVDHWNAWKQGSTQTFAEVPTPKKAGYTPDKVSVPATVVNPLDHNQTIDVTYTPDMQKVIITFIDDTDNGKTLKTVTKTGPTNSSVGYTTGDDINTYKGQHYVLVSDQTHGQNITFDTDKNADQRYEVHLKHGTHPINDQRTITETVHYKMADGTTAPADHTAKAEFSRDGFNDEVTGDDHWNAWTPSATHQFDAVQSPVVEGYTPDVDQITAVTVNPDSQNIDRTVTYTPNVQIAHVKYIDDTDHKVLTQDDLNGRTGETSGYHTADRITEFKGQHYDLVSDNYPTNGIIFDSNDRVDQSYEVHFTHATRTDEQDVQVPRTIKYVYQNGQPAQPDHTDALSFHETKVVDLVDGHTVSDDWTPAQDFKAVKTPAIQGYTPDHASVSNVGIVHDHPAIVETVTYNPDAQKAVVKYIDDTTGEQLEAKDLTGVSDQSTGYNTKSTIDGYVARHYDLVSDGTNGETITFDHDDGADQSYEVHFKHATAPVTDHRAKDLIVHYVYANGQARTGKAADDQTAPELTFNRTGVQDLVTNAIAWHAWDHADQTFSPIDSPAIQGYTPDRTVVDNIKVNPDAHDSTEVTVIYNADVQKLTVNFIDDTTGKTLKTVVKTGYSDDDAAYSTKADIQNFVGQHYDLVSDATKGAELVFDHDDDVDQVYNVHLNHHLTPISDHQVVNETIHYVYADGLARTGKAADDYTATPLEFNRTGNHDDVTGTDSWNAWVPGSASFAAVQSPVIQGYTPDQAQIDAASVNADSQDIVKTVTYSADPQTVTVDFIDDTDNGKVLKTVTKTGGSDEAVGYNTKVDIQTFVDGHYKLDHDTSNGANLVFDHDDAVDQHYEVHLTHETTPITETTSTSQVIHYQLADGTPVAKDYTAKVDFSRDGFKDLVTNADHWNAWTPNATQTFDAVKSPAKAGYTPDHAQVDAVTVEPHHANLETTVTYSPDAQKVAVKYIDDVTGKTLQTKELTGVSDETPTYTTESTIKQYVGQHYKLVSDQTNGKPVIFDHDDDSDQVFEVHFTHTYQSVSQEHQVHQTIHYQYADGKQARPDYTAKALAFSRTGIQDLVTENIQWNAWTPDQVFAAVDTPAVNGYTPDVQTVAPVKVGHDSHDIVQTVVYHADDQTILVNYIDDDTHSTLKTDSIIGKTAQTSDYTTKKSLDQYKGQHYDVVSDDTKGDTLAFDTDSTKVQTYNVHLKHQHQVASDKATVHQTVHYVYQDGKQAARDHTATPIEFTRTGDTDLVTGKTTWNAWTPATGTFVAVLSPVITGYTPSRAMIDHVDVHPGDKDLDTTVTYVPDRQVIVVNYIDQTTGKTLKTDTLNGHSDQTSGYTTKSQIDSYLGQHYKLISDATNGQTLTFDHDDQATQTYDVVLGHQTEAAHRTHEVHETVDYVYADGSQAAKSFTAQPLVFSQTGVRDLVTNIINWNGEWTKPQVFVAVESPKIIGFTASKPEVKAVEVNHQSSDVHELVIYAANAQTAQIKYIDDVTGKALEVDGANGHFNESIVFSHNVNDQINKFKQAHYKLVSNNFDGQKYQADNTKNIYEVHLIHERQSVHATDSVTETVKFQYANGSQAQQTKIQTVNFGRDGIKDLVTGTIAWMPVDPQTIGAVDVPAIDGYTADINQVPAVKVNFGDKDITKVVTYTANDQNAGIKIIDDTTGKVLDTQVVNGKFGTEIQFKQNPDQQLIDLQAQHYELVSDNFKHQKYQADNTKNQFEIHVKHQMMDAQRTDKVTETVRYQDNHGNTLHPVTTQTKMFTEHGIADQVTGKTVWTPTKSQTMDAVSAPEITGYTPNKSSVPATTVNFGDKDINEVIVYTPVSETANIKYIDDTTGKTLLSDQVTGDFGSQIKFDHDPLTQINRYEGQGYKLVSNSYGKTAHQFSATSGENNFEVHFKHGTTPVIDTDKVTETIHYLGPDGNKLAPDKTQTITFTRHGIKDQVTGQIDWNSVEPQEFKAVKSPVINGYQADIAVVEGRQVLFGDQDVVVNVRYTKLPEQQLGKQSGTGMVNTGTVTPDTGKHLGTGMANTGKITPEKVVAVANGTVQETKQNPVKNSAQSTMQDTKQLPQTGNDNRVGLLGLVGSSLIAGLAIFGLNKKKKHEN